MYDNEPDDDSEDKSAPPKEPSPRKTIDWGSLKSENNKEETQQPLSEIWIKKGATQTLYFWTLELEPVNLHWVDDPAHKGYYHCPETGCPLCRLDNRKEVALLVPAYHVDKARVGILKMAAPSSTNSLSIILANLFDPATFQGMCVRITRADDGYRASALGAKSIKPATRELIDSFEARLKRGELDLGSVYPRLNASELSSIPTIRDLLDLNGLEDDLGEMEF